MGMTIEEIENDIYFAKVIIGAIHHVNTPMLMYQGEKDVVEKALRKYIDELEAKQRGL